MSSDDAGMPGLPHGGGLGACDRILDRVERALSMAAGLLLLVMGALITLSVLAREQLSVTLPDDILLVSLSMVAVVALPLAHVQRERGQIAVTIVTDRLPPAFGRFGQVAGDLIGAVLFGTIAVLVLTAVPQAFAENHYYDGQLRIPVWPTKVIFGLGMGLFALRLGLCALAGLLVRRGRRRADG